MVRLYCTLIINKRTKFEDVPVNLQDAVKAALLEMGYDTNGSKIEETM